MPTQRRIQKIQRVASTRQQGIVVLEDIYDPHNAEAVFRTCDAFGLQHVYLIFEQQEPFNPRQIGKSTSSSANKWLDFTIFDSTAACINHLQEENFEVIATLLDHEAESIFTSSLGTPEIAIMFGNEHRGLSEMALNMADRHVVIPMRGMVQSLNLSVAAAICLFEMSRQRHAQGIEDYYLPDDKQDALVAEFLER
jgi:tRNA (guanosine-2'-O-)-methyltransferase